MKSDTSRYSLRAASPAVAVLLASAITLASCASAVPPDLNQAKDFTSTGFIDDGTLQVIVVAEADKSVRGLVARRDSARKNAERNFAELAAGGIADFRLGQCPKNTHAPQSRGQQSIDQKRALMESSRLFVENGKRVAEYYREDESLVIVFRIAKSGIRSDIDALKCEPAPSVPSDTKSAGGPR